MSGVKWSDDSIFIEGGNCQIGDKIMGLRGGLNYKFDFPSDGIKDGNGNYLISWSTTGAASTDYLEFSNGEAGTPSSITVVSSNANANIDINLKGTGVLDIIGRFSINGSTIINEIIDDDTMASATANNIPSAESVVAYIASSPGGAAGSNGQIQYNNGGALAGDSGFTTDGAGNISITGTIDAGLTNGELLIGNTGNPAAKTTLTGGAGITITNGAGTITISGTGGGYGWTEVTGTSQAMANNNGYIANNVALVTLTLPATASIGDTLIVQGKGAGGWRIAQNAGQTINFGSSATTTGASGYLEFTNQFDSVELLCITANTDWAVLTAPQGALTVV